MDRDNNHETKKEFLKVQSKVRGKNGIWLDESEDPFKTKSKKSRHNNESELFVAGGEKSLERHKNDKKPGSKGGGRGRGRVKRGHKGEKPRPVIVIAFGGKKNFLLIKKQGGKNLSIKGMTNPGGGGRG